MTLASAMNSALSGLNAQSRAAELVSSNVANATTEGYATRSLSLSNRLAGTNGAGVRVDGVVRQADDAIIGERRLAAAQVGYDSTYESFFAGLENVIGTPDEAGSLSGRIAAFEAALQEAASRPDSDTRLAAVLNSAQSLVSHIQQTADHIQSARLAADQDIATQTDQLNTALQNVEKLNVKIAETTARGQDASGLVDLRQVQIDQISEIVPVKQVARERGQVALITTNGALLLDGKASELSFSSVNMIVPEMTLSGGALSGLTLNDQPVDLSGSNSPLAGGSLAASFAVRDELAVTAQAQVDAVARDLVERFQDPAIDTSRASSAAGLFTDAGSAFVTSDEMSLSFRLSVNALVDPDQGGDLWRLRDGLGASTPGDVGNGNLLGDLASALSSSRVTASGGFSPTAKSASGLTSTFLSLVSGARTEAETQMGFASAQFTELKEAELARGVDTDAEMQKLLLIEQAYAANAQVISAADEMMQRILSL